VKDVPFTPLTEARTEATVFSCSLCGTRFTHGGQACGGCPLNLGCDVVSCPRCGHSFPRTSRVVGWFRRLLSRVRSGREGGQEPRSW
jgi:hypothetical protein